MQDPKLGVFVKSCRRDLGWLAYSLQLLEKNWRGPVPEVCVVLDRDCERVVSTWGLAWPRYHYVDPWADGYSHAMVLKATADTFLPDADLIMLLDSDTMLTRACLLKDLLIARRPVLEFRFWNDSVPSLAIARTVWQPVVARSTGLELACDFMVSALRIYHRSTFQLVRQMVEKHCQKPFMEALYSDVPFSPDNFLSHPITFCENETLGLLATLSEPDRYTLRNQDELGQFKIPFVQWWSHGIFPETYLESTLRSRADDHRSIVHTAGTAPR